MILCFFHRLSVQISLSSIKVERTWSQQESKLIFNNSKPFWSQRPFYIWNLSLILSKQVFNPRILNLSVMLDFRERLKCGSSLWVNNPNSTTISGPRTTNKSLNRFSAASVSHLVLRVYCPTEKFLLTPPRSPHSNRQSTYFYFENQTVVRFRFSSSAACFSFSSSLGGPESTPHPPWPLTPLTVNRRENKQKCDPSSTGDERGNLKQNFAASSCQSSKYT